MVSESATHGWYYKVNGQTIGPLSTGQLQELLGSGQLPARQVVWIQRQQRLLFVRAATAAADTSRLPGETHSR
jgi:phenylpropionate dioxygenase-like ring-hydroxylating dioxygenase large terminal subunit